MSMSSTYFDLIRVLILVCPNWDLVGKRSEEAVVNSADSSFPRRVLNYSANLQQTGRQEMPGRGFEPLRIAPPGPKSGASANFATLALEFQSLDFGFAISMLDLSRFRRAVPKAQIMSPSSRAFPLRTSPWPRWPPPHPPTPPGTGSGMCCRPPPRFRCPGCRCGV